MRLLQRNFIVLFNTKKKMNESLTQTTVKQWNWSKLSLTDSWFHWPFFVFSSWKIFGGEVWERKDENKNFQSKIYSAELLYIWVFHLFSCFSITLFTSAQVFVWLDSFFCQSSVISQTIFRSLYSRFQVIDHWDHMYYHVTFLGAKFPLHHSRRKSLNIQPSRN